MEAYRIKNLSFSYPDSDIKALDDVSFVINRGEFVTICGKSGCGKTTLLRLLKSSLAPFGKTDGEIFFESKKISETDTRVQTSEIGFVMQSPDNQIVTDKVWHELAFGLESLGYSTTEIRSRVAEMASFFGIQTWFHKKVTELSGGQKQLLNLASVMVMHPSVLILDEPTGQLDPIAASEFLNTLKKINRELGTTVILSEHRLEEAIPASDRVIVIDEGKVIADGTPGNIGKILKNLNHDMYIAMPTPLRVYSAAEDGDESPLTVREGRRWLEKYAENNFIDNNVIPKTNTPKPVSETAVEIKDVWFRYEKEMPDVIKDLNVKVGKGEIFAVTGGNGTGKTTMLSLISGLNHPYRGEIKIDGVKISQIQNLYDGVLGVLPQNPQTLFVKKTVKLDLIDILSDKKLSEEEKEKRINNIVTVCRIDKLLDRHPYDLSGGQQQRVALAKILLLSPRILLLDEPTKGMDAHFKKIFAGILKNLKVNGVTVIMVSHDIEFCAENADRCALMFDGNIIASDTPRSFFAGKSFYTTAANRMARSVIPQAMLAEDIILACGGTVHKNNEANNTELIRENVEISTEKNENVKCKLHPLKAVIGVGFFLLFVLTCIVQLTDISIPYLSALKETNSVLFQLISIIEFAVTLICFLPSRKQGTEVALPTTSSRKLTKRTLLAAVLILLAVPFTIYVGMVYLDDKKYYFISLLIIIETMIPFFWMFEDRKPQARELVVISVLCAIAVAGRTAFFMLPQFKPVAAVVIIAGVCFGGETGFLVGVITGFVSNFFFGQGPWTQWQMFAFGVIGFLAGVLFKKGLLRRNKISLCIFGGLTTFFIYGGIINPSSVLMIENNPTKEMFISYYIAGAPFDLLHAASTSFFLWFIAEPMIEKIERIKVKYGLIDR